MEQIEVANLTFALYRVSKACREEKLLQEKMRVVASRVLSGMMVFLEANPVTLEQKQVITPKVLQDIEELLEILEHAKERNLADPRNFLVLEREYERVKEAVQALEIPKREEAGSTFTLPVRQTKILEILQNKERAQVWELQRLLPEVTKRTLRRDLDELLRKGLVERAGEWNNVFYILKK